MITVTALINSPVNHVWKLWTTPEDVMQWNFAHESWHCPDATNNFTVGGEFHYTMAAKDGSFEFDFWGTYELIENHKLIKVTLGDKRKLNIEFTEIKEGTLITESFEPEKMNSEELQKQGWQSILNNFKQYVESNRM